jgi:hypothetical protein
MSPDNIWTIKVILGVLGGLFGVLAAVLGFCETAQNEKYDDTKAWFGAKWQSINRSRWLTLPERVVRWFIQAGEAAWLVPVGGVVFHQGWWLYTILTLPPFSMFLVCLYYLGWLAAICFIVLAFIIMLLGGLLSKTNPRLATSITGVFIAVVYLSAAMFWTYMLLQLRVYYAVPVMLVLFPVFWAMFSASVIWLKYSIAGEVRGPTGNLILFGFGVVIGFTVTFVALMIGHAADPSAYVPQTFQMLTSNVLFDGLTMVVTFAILSWAVGRGWLFSIPLAVFLDLVAAVVLACCSLYFALVNTEHALSVRELLWVLVAHSPDGSRVELSPYFWTMHTTFLPTFAYLALILVTWFAKLLLTPVRWFFGKGHEHKSPLKLTAALCTTISVIFGLLFLGAGSAYERAKEKAATVPPAVVK